MKYYSILLTDVYKGSVDIFFHKKENAFKFAEKSFINQIVLSKDMNDDSRVDVYLKLDKIERRDKEVVGIYDIVDTRLIKIEKEIQEEVKEEGKAYIPYKEIEKEIELKKGFDIFMCMNEKDDGFRVYPIFNGFKMEKRFMISDPIRLDTDHLLRTKKVNKVYVVILIYTDTIDCMDDK
jgi:hypothetical protein